MSTPRESPPVRVGIVGTGALGTMIGRQFAPLNRGTVVALADVDGASLERAGAELGVPSDGRFTNHESMLDEAGLDAVVVTTPHALHDAQITSALDRDLDVLCEKPLVLDLDRAKALRDRVAASDRVLMVGYQRHLDPAFQRARERYSDDSPPVEFVTAEITQDWVDAFEGGWRLDPSLSGGGFLADTGRHVVDGLLWVTGLRPTEVRASMTFLKPGVDRRVHLEITFDNGAAATVALDGDASGVRESLHVRDGAGGVVVQGYNWGYRDLTILDPDGTEEIPYLDGEATANKAEAFLAAILDGRAPPADPADAVRTTAVVDAAYEAAASGSRVSVDLD